MIEHLEKEHQGEGKEKPANETFKMKIHKRYRNALERQLGEALNIARAGGAGSDGLLNRKEEYSRCVVPELSVSEGWKGETTQKRIRDQETTTLNPTHTKRPRKAEPERGPQEDTQQQQQQRQGHPDEQQQAGEGTTATRHPTETTQQPPTINNKAKNTPNKIQ